MSYPPIQQVLALTSALLLASSTSARAQPVQNAGEEDSTAQETRTKETETARQRNAEVMPALGGRVLSECSAGEATERLTQALGTVRAVKNLRMVPGRSIQLEYRGKEVALQVTAHGPCQSSFQASLPYLGRPGEESVIKRAYRAVMEPSVAALAECEPTACLNQAAKVEKNRQEANARAEAAAVAQAVRSAPREATASSQSKEDQARRAAQLAYLKALSGDKAYVHATRIVREALPSPLTAQFPEIASEKVSVSLLAEAPKALTGLTQLNTLRTNLQGDVLPQDLQERFKNLVGEIEAQVGGACYQVTGYVDFQNRCGALVRGRYEIYISKREGADWFALDSPVIDFPDCPGR